MIKGKILRQYDSQSADVLVDNMTPDTPYIVELVIDGKVEQTMAVRTDAAKAITTITQSAMETMENRPVGSNVGMVHADGSPVEWSIEPSDKLYVDPDGIVRTKFVFDYEQQQEIPYVITAKNDISQARIKGTLFITNDKTDDIIPPTKIDVTTLKCKENLPAGQEIGKAVTDGTFVTWVIQPSSIFAIDKEGNITTKVPLDYETQPTIPVTITAKNENGVLDTTRTVIVLDDITDNVYPPKNVTVGVLTIQENTPAGTKIGSVQAEGTKPFTYVITPSDKLAILPNGDIVTKVIFDYEKLTTLPLTVTVSNSAGVEKAVTSLSITDDVSDNIYPPTQINLSALEVRENLPAGESVGQAVTDGTQPITWNIEPSDTFEISPTGVITTKKPLDYEVTPTINVTVVATNPNGTLTQTSTVSVKDDLSDNIDPPTTVTVPTMSIMENMPAGQLVGKATTNGTAPITWSITPTSKLAIDADGNITTTSSYDYETEPSFVVVVKATNSKGTKSETTTLTVLNNSSDDVLSPSKIILPSMSIKENSPVGTSLGTATSDGTAPITWTIEPADKLDIDSTGKITTKVSFDYELLQSLSVVVKATNSKGFATKAGTLTITDDTSDNTVAPTAITVPILQVRENLPAGQSLGIATTNGSAPITWTISPSDKLAIDGTGNITTKKSFDYETLQNFVATIVATNSDGSKAVTQTVTITDDTSDNTTPPTSVTVTALTVKENMPVGTQVGRASANGTAPIVWQISPSDKFAIDSDGYITTRVEFDYETIQSLNVDITASNSDGSKTATKVVNITDDTADNISAPSYVTVPAMSVKENLPAGQALGKAITDGTAPITWTLTPTDKIAIDSNGNITTKVPLDYESVQHISITVKAENSKGFITKVGVVDVLDDTSDNTLAPTVVSIPSLSIMENKPVGTSLGQATTNGSTPITWTISPSDKLAIDTNGNITSKVVFDYETTTSLPVTVTAANSDGSKSQSGTLTITNDLGDDKKAPTTVTISPSATTIQENLAAGTAVATATSDGSPPPSWTVIPSDKFAINTVGDITTKIPLDYEAYQSILVTATAMNSEGSKSATMTVTVTDDASDNASAPIVKVIPDLRLPENNAVGKFMYQAEATGTAPITWTITPSDKLLIDSTGKITAKIAYDYESYTSFNASVTATNSEGSNTKAFVVNIDDDTSDNLPVGRQMKPNQTSWGTMARSNGSVWEGALQYKRNDGSTIDVWRFQGNPSGEITPMTTGVGKIKGAQDSISARVAGNVAMPEPHVVYNLNQLKAEVQHNEGQGHVFMVVPIEAHTDGSFQAPVNQTYLFSNLNLSTDFAIRKSLVKGFVDANRDISMLNFYDADSIYDYGNTVWDGNLNENISNWNFTLGQQCMDMSNAFTKQAKWNNKGKLVKLHFTAGKKLKLASFNETYGTRTANIPEMDIWSKGASTTNIVTLSRFVYTNNASKIRPMHLEVETSSKALTRASSLDTTDYYHVFSADQRARGWTWSWKITAGFQGLRIRLTYK